MRDGEARQGGVPPLNPPANIFWRARAPRSHVISKLAWGGCFLQADGAWKVHRLRGVKIGKVKKWFYRKTLIPGIPLPSDSPPLLILILMIMRRGLGRRVACRSQDRR